MKHYTKYKIYCFTEKLYKIVHYIAVFFITFCAAWGIADILFTLWGNN